MPKNRKVVKHDGVSTSQNVASKLRIGTRSSGSSASLMSTKRLLEVLDDGNLKKYHNNARVVLNSRQVSA